MQAEADPESDNDYAPESPTRVGWLWRVLIVAVISLLVVATIAWFSRERIASNLIDGALRDAGLEASYDIVSIGTDRQTIANLVIGDPSAPDLTAERVNVDIVYSFGAPTIGRVELVHPRVYGTLRDGELSLGSLDPLIFAESDEPAGLPELDIAMRDGRALIVSDYGRIGAKLEGAGRIDDGFRGKFAATAPGIGTEGCRAQGATLYGNVATNEGRIGFDGPLRLRGADCDGASIASADVAARISLSQDFTAIRGDFDIEAADLAQGDTALNTLAGTADIAWAFDGELSLRHELTGQGFASAYAAVDRLNATGTLRSTGGLDHAEWDSDFSASGVAAEANALALADAREATQGTFAGNLLSKLERGLTRALRRGDASASMTVRVDGDSVRAIVPEARLRNAAGETVIALSRLSYTSATQDRPQRLTGNILTGGADMPRINGRMERVAGGDIILRLAMAEYREGGDALAIPRLELRQDNRGNLTFNAMVQAEGAIPGGEVRGLVLPLEGTWTSASGLAVGRRCTDVRIGGLRTYDLALAERSLTLCPVDGGAIASYTDSFRLAARTDDLDLRGELAGTPTRIAAASAVVRYPGPFRIDGLDAVIGPEDNAVRLSASGLEGTFSETIGGRFEGGSAAIDAVPLDLSELAGSWAYEGNVLRIGEGSFKLTERIDPANGPQARFEPVIAKDATLTLENNAIRAQAALRHPDTGSLVTNVAVRHDLSSGRGRADLDVPGVTFTEDFQPEDLSYLARGVIALADGTVRGEGQVVWTPDTLDSSGTFSTDSFDFAAAFGPVREVSGTITFTDLLGLTTAPSQSLNIGAINTGVEVLDGRVVYSIENGTLITVEDGRWPFMGGQLILRPVTLDFGGETGQSYIFEIVALDAATFVSQLELDNLSATGTFDGTIPILFDADGNGTIEGGILVSRPPGGNVAYVGELTYEDLGTMGNYAFQTLRSLDYNQMLIELNGNLAGEILTQFRIDGVRQGAGTSKNFITRQLADLPIRFNINIRSENFYLLATIVRGLFDPTVFGNPIEQGLFDVEDGRFVPPDPEPDPDPDPNPDTTYSNGDAPRRPEPDDEATVQAPESDEMP